MDTQFGIHPVGLQTLTLKCRFILLWGECQNSSIHLHVPDIVNTMLIEKLSYYVLANAKPICHSLAFASTTFRGFGLSAGVYEFLIIWGSFCQLEWTSSHQCTSWVWVYSSRFADEPKTHPLPLPREFSAPFSAPKSSPSYLPPPAYLPHLISSSLHLESSVELSSFSPTELHGTRLEKGAKLHITGMWKAQRSQNIKRMKEEHFIPKVEVREER